MVCPALLPLMRTSRLPVVDWTDAPHKFKWTRPFRQKTKSGFCEYAITFRPASTSLRYTFNGDINMLCSLGSSWNRIVQSAAGRSGTWLRQDQEILSAVRPDQLWGPPRLLLRGTLLVKRPDRAVNRAPAFGAEVKNEWRHTATAPSIPYWLVHE